MRDLGGLTFAIPPRQWISCRRWLTRTRLAPERVGRSTHSSVVGVVMLVALIAALAARAKQSQAIAVRCRPG